MNEAKWHVHIVPEDEIYQDMAKGFVRGLPSEFQRQIKIENPSGGWGNAFERVKELQRFPNDKRILIVLTDFDSPAAPSSPTTDDANIRARRQRAEEVRASGQNVFIIGPLEEAEDLKSALASKLSKMHRPDVEDENSAVKCGAVFSSADMVCDRSLWAVSQLQHNYNQEQLDELCPLLQRKFAAEAKRARV